MASRDIAHLHPAMQGHARELLVRCKEQGIDLLIYCTYRSPAEQESEYQRGRTTPGNPCSCGGKRNLVGQCAKHPLGLVSTFARAGQSRHNKELADGTPAAEAFDLVPLRNGKPVWGTRGDGIDENPDDDATDDLELWQRVGEIGESIGLEWAGRWTKMREFPHFQKRITP